MGCFSFKCLECGRGIRSSSFNGENVHLFLLKDAKVIQKMSGAYDSYGRVFINGTQSKEVKHPLRQSRQWAQVSPFTPEEIDKAKRIGEEHTIWHQVCNLMHDDENIKNGIAAVHFKCYKGKEPKFRSPSDPDQGWASKQKPIKGYDPLKEHTYTQLRSKLWRVERDLEHRGLMMSTSSLIKGYKKEWLETDKKLVSNLKRKKTKLEKQIKALGDVSAYERS